MRRDDDGLCMICGQVPQMSPQSFQSISEWERAVGVGVSGDPLWTVQAYRLSLYIIECHTFDRRSAAGYSAAPTVDQLTRALGSIAANIAEGYSRSTSADRMRFYGYALGSTREAITWYNTLRIELGSTVDERQALLIQVRRLLLTTLRRSRMKDPTPMLRDSERAD
jgi:four helix bundle protein